VNMGYPSKMGSGASAVIGMRNSRFRSACVVVVLCWLSICFSAPAAGAESPSAKLAGLPLWSALPTRHFIELGGESTARYRWEAFAFRARRSTNSLQVCVAIVSARLYRGVLSYSSGSLECGPVGTLIEAPVLFENGFAEPTRSAIVVVTGTDSVKASVATDRGTTLSARLQAIQGSRARKGRVTPFRYALFVPREEVCIKQVIGFGPGEVVEFETPPRGCGP
jgi:hypothetical protein